VHPLTQVPKNSNIKACTGLISEQAGTKLAGQYLEGGGMQAFFLMDRNAVSKVGNEILTLSKAGEEVMKSGKTLTWIDPASGMHFEIRPTG
jgi:hypothetical protein